MAYGTAQFLPCSVNFMTLAALRITLQTLALSAALLLASLPQLASAAASQAAGQQASAQTVKLPDTPAAHRFATLLETARSGNAEKIQAFCEEAFAKNDEATVKTRIGQLNTLGERLGSAKLLRVGESSETKLVVTLAVPNAEATFTVDVEEAAPHRITGLSVRAEPVAAATGPLTAEDVEKILTDAATQLETKYVYPEIGDKMAARLRDDLKAGAYSGVTDAAELGEKITNELREICHDLHFSLRPAPAGATAGQSPSLMPRTMNHGFVKAEILPGNIGYIKFNLFMETEDALRVANAAMEFVRDADALIFDVRDNGGGSPRMIVCLTSYLFPERTHLNSFYNRPTDSTTETWTSEDEPARRFRADLPVYVLTSKRTFSAAEEFTYDLQCLKRATIVGETTGGGAHPVRGEVIGGGKMLLRVPYARAINPITNTNWEGVGVKPDVESAAADALDKALELIRAGAAGETSGSAAGAAGQQAACGHRSSSRRFL